MNDERRVPGKIHGPTLRRMLRRPRWAGRLAWGLIVWAARCAWRRQRPSQWNVPLSVVNLWPADPPAREAFEEFNRALEDAANRISRATGHV